MNLTVNVTINAKSDDPAPLSVAYENTFSTSYVDLLSLLQYLGNIAQINSTQLTTDGDTDPVLE